MAATVHAATVAWRHVSIAGFVTLSAFSCGRRGWSTQDEKELRRHSRSKTPVKDISKTLKRRVGAPRQKALSLGIPLGHRRSKKKRA